MLQIYVEGGILTRCRQCMEIVEANPHIMTEITKSLLVLVPVAIKVCRAISASLDDNPATPIFLLVALHLEYFGILSLYFKNSTLLYTSVVQFFAV